MVVRRRRKQRAAEHRTVFKIEWPPMLRFHTILQRGFTGACDINAIEGDVDDITDAHRQLIVVRQYVRAAQHRVTIGQRLRGIVQRRDVHWRCDACGDRYVIGGRLRNILMDEPERALIVREQRDLHALRSLRSQLRHHRCPVRAQTITERRVQSALRRAEAQSRALGPQFHAALCHLSQQIRHTHSDLCLCDR